MSVIPLSRTSRTTWSWASNSGSGGNPSVAIDGIAANLINSSTSSGMIPAAAERMTSSDNSRVVMAVSTPDSRPARLTRTG